MSRDTLINAIDRGNVKTLKDAVMFVAKQHISHPAVDPQGRLTSVVPDSYRNNVAFTRRALENFKREVTDEQLQAEIEGQRKFRYATLATTTISLEKLTGRYETAENISKELHDFDTSTISDITVQSMFADVSKVCDEIHRAYEVEHEREDERKQEYRPVTSKEIDEYRKLCIEKLEKEVENAEFTLAYVEKHAFQDNMWLDRLTLEFSKSKNLQVVITELGDKTLTTMIIKRLFPALRPHTIKDMFSDLQRCAFAFLSVDNAYEFIKELKDAGTKAKTEIL